MMARTVGFLCVMRPLLGGARVGCGDVLAERLRFFDAEVAL